MGLNDSADGSTGSSEAAAAAGEVLGHQNNADQSQQPMNHINISLKEAEDAHSTCFVFYIPPSWTDQDLRGVFERFGTIDSCHVLRKPDRSSKGYGFVKFHEGRSAIEAIKGVHGMRVSESKRLKVQLKSKHNPSHRPRNLPGCTIFVFHLPADWTDAVLKQHFCHFGKILQVTVSREAGTGRSKGYGFVTFERVASAINAVNGMNGFSAGNKFLKVQIKKGSEHLAAPRAAQHSYYIPPNYYPPPPQCGYIHYQNSPLLARPVPGYGGGDMAMGSHGPPPPYFVQPPPPVPHQGHYRQQRPHQNHRSARHHDMENNVTRPSPQGPPPPPPTSGQQGNDAAAVAALHYNARAPPLDGEVRNSNSASGNNSVTGNLQSSSTCVAHGAGLYDYGGGSPAAFPGGQWNIPIGGGL